MRIVQSRLDMSAGLFLTAEHRRHEPGATS